MCPKHRTIIIKRGDLDFDCRFCKCDAERTTGMEAAYKSRIMMMRTLILLLILFVIASAILAGYFFSLMLGWG